MDYTDNVSPAPLLGWWAPRLAPVPSPAHTPVRRAPAAPPWAPGWIKKLLWIMSAKISTCSCSFLLGRRSCSSSLVGFFLLCMGFCDNNNIDGLSRRCALIFSGQKSLVARETTVTVHLLRPLPPRPPLPPLLISTFTRFPQSRVPSSSLQASVASRRS